MRRTIAWFATWAPGSSKDLLACLFSCAARVRAPSAILEGGLDLGEFDGADMEAPDQGNKTEVPNNACVCGLYMRRCMRGLSVIVGDNQSLDHLALLARRSCRRLNRLEDCPLLASSGRS